MKLSWSHKLFFKINTFVGKSRFVDTFFYFCAHWLIYILFVIVILWGSFVLVDKDPNVFIRMIKLLITALIFSEICSYSIAILWRHPRPIIEFPEIKNLLSTIETWKSFPSDHTIISFILSFIVIMVGAHIILSIVLICIAILIAFGRIFVGVHYPRDIIGGFFIALFFSLTSYWMVEQVSQPIYNFFKIFLI